MLLTANTLSIIDNNTSQLRMHFELGNYHMQDSNSKIPVVMQEKADNYVLNNYNLPSLNYMIQVPNHCRAIVKLSNLKITRQEHIVLSAIDKDLPISSEYINISAPFIMRGNILATLMIQPFLYADKSKNMQILTEADIEIDFLPDASVSLNKDTKKTRQFKQWLSQSVINYRDNTRSGEAIGSFLVFYNQDAAALSYIQPLLDWKHQKGWEVHAVNTQEIGNNTNSIKNYIQNAYDTWENPPEYILMVGKATQTNTVPTYWVYYNHNTVGDYQYCLLDGNDIIPDAYIGRFSFSSAAQLSAMVSKTINYEKMTGFSSYNWYNRAILCPDNTDSGPSCTTTMDYVKNLMSDYSSQTQFTYINSGTLSSQMMSAMNLGASNFYYRGHNGYSGLTNSNISGLVNNGMYPFICFITCFSGNFGTTSSNCIGDQFMRVGTASNPLGGIGFIGAACETHTCLNNIMTGAVAYGFYKEGLTNQGQALLRSKIGLLACYPQYPIDYIPENFQSINLLGDPTVDIWLKQPENIHVDYDTAVPLLNGSLQVTVTEVSDGNPVKNARVCLLKGSDEIFQTGFTDANGVIVFAWNSVTTGTGRLTVTNPNYYTYQGTVSFNSQTINWFTLSNMSSFNQLDSGTIYSFPLSLVDNQDSTLDDVTACLTSSSEYVEIISGNLNLGHMGLSQIVTSLQNVEFRVLESCPANEVLAFQVHIQGIDYLNSTVSKNINFNVNERGPDLTIISSQIGTDNVLIPGETSQLTFTIKNIGTGTANNVIAHLSCPNPNISINEGTQSFGNIASNATAINTTSFSISANQSIYTGTPVKLVLEITYNNDSTQMLMKNITIGNVLTSSMTGPDEYGYICVANSDNHPFANPYNWIEINPSLGGCGTTLSLFDSDTNGSGSYQTVSMPFSFRYYGVMYNQITICSNGFIMPGSNGSQEWMNWAIPGPMVLKPIIAPFWDDLIIQSSSKIVYKYDTDNNSFIVEWSQLKNRYDTSQTETFEVVIYDVLQHPTSTGDNAFLFQYKSFHNVDAGNYGVVNVDHGQYATVGIADHTGLIGLQYTYQATYPVSATALASNSTLYFTTIPAYTAAPIPVVLSCPYIETNAIYPNNQIDCGETISLSPIITNSGNANLKSSTLLLSTNDPYISIINDSYSLVEILPGQNAAIDIPFIIVVSQNCPNMRQINFHLQYSTTSGNYGSDFSVIVHAPQVSFSYCLIDGVTNPVLNPNTTVPVIMQIQNMSNLPIDGNFAFEETANCTLTLSQFNCSIPAFSTFRIESQISILPTALSGDELTIRGLFSSNSYDSLFTKQLMIGNWDDLLLETFDNPIMSPGWHFAPGIEILPASYIHESGSEIIISPSVINQVYKVESPLLNGFDCQRVQVEFTYCNFNPNVANGVYISYDQGNTWNSLYTFNTVQISPVHVQFNIDDLPANLQTIKLKWVTISQSENTSQVILDDIHIQAIHHALGYISGNINLEYSAMNITQVRIAPTLFPEQFVHPDENGLFILPLYRGTYSSIKAELANFLPQYQNNIVVTSDQTTADINFAMSYLEKPVNLTYALNENTLSLSWCLESPPAKSKNRMLPDFYCIYMQHNNTVIEDTTSSMNYQYVMTGGNYTIYTKSVFHDIYHAEILSDSSNVLQFTYTANNDALQSRSVFALSRNYPNPFNPTTKIDFSIKHFGRTILQIYNIKGQLVNTLVDEAKAPGKYSVTFDGKDINSKQLASGVYFYRLSSGNQTITNKMILMK